VGIIKHIFLWTGIVGLFLSISSFRDGEPDKIIIGSWDFESIAIESNSDLLDSILFQKVYEDRELGNIQINFLDNNVCNFRDKTTYEIKEPVDYKLDGDSLYIDSEPYPIYINTIDNNTLFFEVLPPHEMSTYQIREFLRYRYTDEEIDMIDVESIKMQKAIFKLRRVKSSTDE